MPFRLGTTMRNGAANGIVTKIDTGVGAGNTKIYTGTQPGSVGGAYGTLLGTCPMSATSFGAASVGVCTAAAITNDSSADASGTAQSFTLTDGSLNVLADGTCGLGTGDMSFDNNVIVAGGVIAISSMTITVPIQ